MPTVNITATLSGQKIKLGANVIGYHLAKVFRDDFFNSVGQCFDLDQAGQALVRSLPGNCVRFPAGTAGIDAAFNPGSTDGGHQYGVNSTSPTPGVNKDNSESTNFHLDAMQFVLSSRKTRMVYMHNRYQDTADLLAFLQAMAAQGTPIKEIELGNEVYLSKGAALFPTWQPYEDWANAQMSSVRAVYPKMRFSIPIPRSEDMQARPAAWRAALIAAVQAGTIAPDALSPHIYGFIDAAAYTDGSLTAAGAAAWIGTVNEYDWLNNGVVATYGPLGLPFWLTEYSLNGGSGEGEDEGGSELTTHLSALWTAERVLAYRLLNMDLPKVRGVNQFEFTHYQTLAGVPGRLIYPNGDTFATSGNYYSIWQHRELENGRGIHLQHNIAPELLQMGCFTNWLFSYIFYVNKTSNTGQLAIEAPGYWQRHSFTGMASGNAALLADTQYNVDNSTQIEPYSFGYFKCLNRRNPLTFTP